MAVSNTTVADVLALCIAHLDSGEADEARAILARLLGKVRPKDVSQAADGGG